MNKDIIYRQAAIDVINHELRCGAVIDQCGLETAHDLIEELPSAQTEWIPVSKRPPDEGTYVLISKKPDPLSGKKWCVTIAGRFVDGRSRKVEWRDIGFGRIYDDDVLAWMPRPEPYGGEQDG